jgi:hypothetical protein
MQALLQGSVCLLADEPDPADTDEFAPVALHETPRRQPEPQTLRPILVTLGLVSLLLLTYAVA